MLLIFFFGFDVTLFSNCCIIYLGYKLYSPVKRIIANKCQEAPFSVLDMVDASCCSVKQSVAPPTGLPN